MCVIAMGQHPAFLHVHRIAIVFLPIELLYLYANGTAASLPRVLSVR
jgi:hypothetical protein